MNERWINASPSVGIPTSFVVGRDGHIALSGVRRNWMAFCRKFSAAPHSNEAKAVKAEDWTTVLSVLEETLALIHARQFPRAPCGSVTSQNARHADRLTSHAPIGRDAIDQVSDVWMTGAMRQLFDPATGEEIADVARCSPADMNLAISAAERSFAGWRGFQSTAASVEVCFKCECSQSM